MSFIWNGVSSDTMKFNVTSRQVYNAPAYDLNAIEVPGRSGDLLNPQNRFKNKQVSYTGFLKASDFEGSTWREKLSTGLIQLKGWLCSDAGTYHELTDDYDPGFIRYGYISGETAISDVQDRPFGVTLTVTFSVKPFMYRTGEAMELPETKSASGSIITITDGAENTPLKSCVVNIEPVQDLHGYDYPWPAGGGKNKFETKNVGRTDAGVTYALESDGKIKLTGTASATSYLYTQPTYNMLTLIPAGSYILSGGLSSNIRLVATSYTVGAAPSYTVTKIADIAYDYGNGATFTLSSDTYVGVNFRIQSGQATNVTVGIQIELGSTPTAWQPYSNICPITGHTEVRVNVSGRNLFDKSLYKNLITERDFIDSSYCVKQIKLTPNTEYTVSQNSGTSASSPILLINKYSHVNEYGFLDLRSASSSKTFTTDKSGCLYIGAYYYSNISDEWVYARIEACNIQIELGSTATTYEPHQGTTATIPLGQTVYGGTLDFVRGKLNAKPYYASYSGQTLVGPWVSSHDKYVAGATPTTGAQVVDMGAAGTEYDVTPQTIKTLLGTNNIWADAGEMSIEYPIPTENPYPFGSRPLYEITMAGTGTLVVNGKEWTITDYTGTLYCDTEAMEWYDASQLRNNIVSGDGWPVFEAGENSVSYTGDITKVMVTPRWRTL